MKIEDLNLSALKYFLDAVELESITLSSKKNHVSRPAVSQAILRLEEWYGRPLLRHEKRSFSLTEEGRRFYRTARKNFDSFENGFTDQSNLENSLKVGCSASLIDLVFPRIRTQISQCHKPLIKIGPTQQLLQQLEQKKVHIAFLISTKDKLSHNSFEFYSGNFELRSKSGQLTETLIVSESRPEIESFNRFAVKAKLNFKNTIEVESWTVASRLAEMTNGTCLVPDYLPHDKLKTVSLKGWKFTYSARVAYQKESLLSEVENELLRLLRNK